MLADEFGTLKNQLIHDRIVVGLRNEQLSEEVQLDPDLTLKKEVKTTRRY